MAKIAIFFPGIGYHCDKPLLYYGRDIAFERGYENFRNIQYTYDGGNIRGDKEKMEEAYRVLLEQVETALADVDWSQYDDILFVSKSIGTIIATSYAREHGLLHTKHVLYTPLPQTFLFAPDQAIGFIGTCDPWSDVNEVIAIAKDNNIPLIVYEGVNHSLECDDTLKNLDILKDVMLKTSEYLRKGVYQ